MRKLHLSHPSEWQALTFSLSMADIRTGAEILVQIVLTMFAGGEEDIQCGKALSLSDITGGSGSFFK